LIATNSSNSLYEIEERVEMGKMAEMYLGNVGKYIFYLIIVVRALFFSIQDTQTNTKVEEKSCVPELTANPHVLLLQLYLFGDLAIYAVAIPSSLQRVTGGLHIGELNIECHYTYYVYLGLFVLLVVPWSYFNFQKTKYLQIGTMFVRNSALFTMIVLAIVTIAQGNSRASEVKYFNFQFVFFTVNSLGHHLLVRVGLMLRFRICRNFPSFFGISVYSFMCHHSLPSIIQPIENKKRIKFLTLADVFSVFSVYTLLCVTAQYAFGGDIQQLYTYNFAGFWKPLAIYLQLFPVFTLSSNFPLIAVTLRNNMINLVKAIMGRTSLISYLLVPIPSSGLILPRV
jgi:hypothetical protein